MAPQASLHRPLQGLSGRRAPPPPPCMAGLKIMKSELPSGDRTVHHSTQVRLPTFPGETSRKSLPLLEYRGKPIGILLVRSWQHIT